jgi:hypothetical protein
MFSRTVGREALGKGQEFRYITRASNKSTSLMRATFIQKFSNNNRIILIG